MFSPPPAWGATPRADTTAGETTRNASAELANADVLALAQAVYQAFMQGDWAAALEPAARQYALCNATLGPEHPDTLAAQGTLGFLLTQLERYPEAQALLEPLLPLEEAVLGPEHDTTMLAVKNLATVYDLQERFAQAEPLYQRLVAYYRRTLPATHPRLGAGVGDLAWCLDALGRYDEARPLYEEALRIREVNSEQPDADPDIALALNNLATLDMTQGRVAEAVARQRRALDILTAAYGERHPETANALNNLGMFLDSLGEFAEAESRLRQSIATYEDLYGPEHLTLAKPLNNLAQLKMSLTDYPAALALQERSQAIREARLGREHPDTAMGLHNLAAVHEAMGRYDLAKGIYEDALARAEQALGPRHPYVAQTLSNQAVLASRLGDYDRTEALLQRAIDIQRAALGEANPTLAATLHNLGMLQYNRMQFDNASASFEHSAAVLRAALGPEHPLLGQSLGALCGVRQTQRRLDLALPLCQEALRLLRQAHGDAHAETLLALHNLAGLHADLGDRALAREEFSAVLQGLRALLGPAHPHVAATLANLGRLDAAEGRNATALDLLLDAEAIRTASLDSLMAMTVESEKLAYIAVLENGLHTVLSLTGQRLQGDASAVRRTLDLWLARKGLALEAQRRFQEALYTSPDPAIQARLQELAALRGALSALTLARPDTVSPEAGQARVDELARRRDALELAIARDYAPLARQRRRAAADAATLARLLPPGSALLEIARVRQYRFGEADLQRQWAPARYYAFVLPANSGQSAAPPETTARPVLVDCGDAAHIDALVTRLKQAVVDEANPDAATTAGRALYDALFAPLQPALGNATTVFLSPDGNLNLIPFEILVDAQGRHLILTYTFNYLAAGRDLASREADSPPASLGQSSSQNHTAPPVLLGDPAFDDAISPPTASGAPLSRGAIEALGTLEFPPLPGTAEEIATLARLLPSARILLGANATEANLRAAGRPSLLHLATHGFFVQDESPAVAAASASPGELPGTALARSDEMLSARLVPALSPPPALSPLLRSGLALAGANHAASTGQGLLTAEKVLGLDLAGTSLVTLSACETGLGEALSGEGVFGLRRAFLQAGARRLVMSLWAVPDTETAQLMDRFYRAWLEEGATPSSALRQAALTQRALLLRRTGQAPPFAWGAFILVGEP